MSVVYDGDLSVATVMFDKPLKVQALSAANWMANGSSPLTASVVAPASVQLNFEFSMETPFNLAYLASPQDVVGVPPLELPVAAFTIPVT